jgi:DNA-binding transcriptional LysR family regulator
MELRHLRYFVAVAEELNFTRAAERMGIAQPPLSSQIRDLENEIGTPLFRRVPRGAELTEAGAVFLPEALAILANVESAKKVALNGAKGENGRIRIGFTGSTSFSEIVPRTIRWFRRAYPNVELFLSELNTTQLLDQLEHGLLDAAFIRPARETPPRLRITQLGEDAMMIVLPSSHALATEYALPLQALAGEAFVMFSRTLGPHLYDEVINSCRQAGFEPRIGQVAPQITSIANLVAVELGVSIVPAAIANINVPGVVFKPITGLAPVARLALATRIDDHTAVTRNFRDILGYNFHQRLQRPDKAV